MSLSDCFRGARTLSAWQWLSLIGDATRNGLALAMVGAAAGYGISSVPSISCEAFCDGANAATDIMNCTAPVDQGCAESAWPTYADRECIMRMAQNCSGDQYLEAFKALNYAGEVGDHTHREWSALYGAAAGFGAGAIATVFRGLSEAGRPKSVVSQEGADDGGIRDSLLPPPAQQAGAVAVPVPLR